MLCLASDCRSPSPTGSFVTALTRGIPGRWAAPVAYRRSDDGALRAIWPGERRDTEIGEMTAASSDLRRQLPPKRHKSGSRRVAKRAGASAVCTEELAAAAGVCRYPGAGPGNIGRRPEAPACGRRRGPDAAGREAVSFSIITSGRVEIRHVGPDGQVTVTELSPGTIRRRNRFAAKRTQNGDGDRER